MTTTVQAADLRAVLEAAAQFTTSNGTFSNMFIQGGRVMATDGLSLFVGAVPGLPDSVLAVKDVMHFFRNSPVGSIEIDATEQALKFKSGKFRQTLQKVHALNLPSPDILFNTSFHAIQTSPNLATVQLTPAHTQVFSQMGLYAVPEQDKEYVALQGVNIVNRRAYAATRLCAAGCDCSTIPDFNNFPDFRMPSKFCKVLGAQKDFPVLYLKEGYVWLQYPKFMLVTQRSAIPYPESVLKIVDTFTPHYTYNITAEDAYKKDTVRRLMIGDAATIPIGVTVKDRELRLITRTQENTREALDSLPVDSAQYEDLPFGFNAAYQVFSRALLKTSRIEIMRESGNDIMVAMVQEVGPTLFLRSKIQRGA